MYFLDWRSSRGLKLPFLRAAFSLLLFAGNVSASTIDTEQIWISGTTSFRFTAEGIAYSLDGVFVSDICCGFNPVPPNYEPAFILPPIVPPFQPPILPPIIPPIIPAIDCPPVLLPMGHDHPGRDTPESTLPPLGLGLLLLYLAKLHRS